MGVHVNLSYSCGWCKAFEFWRLLEKNASSTQFQLMGNPEFGERGGELNVPISVDSVRASRYERRHIAVSYFYIL